MFGAVGDGIADDTAAVQAALAAGKVVELPPGIYRVTDTLMMAKPGSVFPDREGSYRSAPLQWLPAIA